MGKTKLLVIALMVAALLSLAPAVLAQPAVSGFYGTVKAGGQNVNNGTIVRAYIDGVQRGVTTTTTSGADSVYVMTIQGADADAGKTVYFGVGGALAYEIGTWRLGYNTQVNLTFAALPSTGDVDLTGLWIGLAAMGLLAVAGGYVLLRRRSAA